MSKYRVEESPSIIRTGHADYERNLKTAESFCQNVKKHLLKGMDVKICDSEHIKKALLIISWKPGFSEKVGNCATPVFLHQKAEDFNKTSENVLNFYMKTVKSHQDRNADQQDFLKEETMKV